MPLPARSALPAVPPWTARDSALWHTCDLVTDLAAGRPAERLLEVMTPFPPQLAADEVPWGAGPYQLFELTAPGEAPRRQRGVIIATGPIGLAATAALAAGRAATNQRRKRAAGARWLPADSGTLYVSGYGITMHSATGLYPWPYRAMTTATMSGPGEMHFTGESGRGRVSWRLRSDWAELAFVTWALAVHPRHPQLVSGEWLPSGWLQRAAAQYRSRLATPALQAGAQLQPGEPGEP